MTASAWQVVTLLGSLCLSAWSCATMVNGRVQEVAITSKPSGATVKITGGELETPATVMLPRKSPHVAIVEKEGYEPAVVEIDRLPSWWNLLDVLWVYFAFIPLMYDLNSGGFYVFDEAVHVDLKPASPVALFGGNALKDGASEEEGRSWSWDVSMVPIVMPVTVSPLPERLAVVAQSETYGYPFPAWLDVALSFLRKRHLDMVIMERDASQPIMEEVLAQYSGRFDEESSVRIGGLVGADTLLTYRLEPIEQDTLELSVKRGGEISGAVEVRLLHVEEGVTLFRQLAIATVKLPAPKEGMTWPEEVARLAHRAAVRQATAYVLAALVAAFGNNPLGLVPDLVVPGEGVLVQGVLHGGPADQADIRKGDRILMVDGRRLLDWTMRVSLPAVVTVERDGKTEEVSVGPQS